MKKLTYGNLLKASRLLMKKGYSKEESLELAKRLFEEVGVSISVYGIDDNVERHIAKVLTKEEYEAEYGKEDM